MKKLICASIGKNTMLEALQQASAVAERTDIIEIRLDLIEDRAVAPFLEQIAKPLLFTNRASWEGGGFNGDESARIALLAEAVIRTAAYVDLELLAPPRSWSRLEQECGRSATKLICSWHNFLETPADPVLLDKLEQMADSGGHIGKIVTMARDYRDVLRVLSLQERAAQLDFPLIAFCMGAAGVISRVASPALGGYMTYCAADNGEMTASGQITVDDMLAIYSYL
ncbi:type I 3-dehydroquinate dehydratase [Desulfopila inferna]|uniref:type I 3-dehydroquinate dehydratase n=1 Tax=Desulfopila inferna TaxID=468528 RepID=UPI001962C00D|nr:type I 3-dehydroquinate dehydratase [Desulfopila inferna]MBM9606690.1 type I 3-dehydroquinate dehydratase [Desulfopila inferna]